MHTRPRVLVAEDEEFVRIFLEGLLEASGCEVHLAADGNEAWQMLSTQAFELLVTDLNMPGLTGFELIERVRETDLLLPVIVVTGLDIGDQLDFYRNGTYLSLLPKPFRAEEFWSELRNALGPVGPALSRGGVMPARVLA